MQCRWHVGGPQGLVNDLKASSTSNTLLISWRVGTPPVVVTGINTRWAVRHELRPESVPWWVSRHEQEYEEAIEYRRKPSTKYRGSSKGLRNKLMHCGIEQKARTIQFMWLLVLPSPLEHTVRQPAEQVHRVGQPYPVKVQTSPQRQ